MTVTDTVPLPPLRNHFALPDGLTYLDCATMSPQLRTTTTAGIESVRRQETPWVLTPSDWFTGPEALRETAASLMGADCDGIALVPSVSYGIATAASNIPVEEGQNIVLLNEQFPSNVYAWRELSLVRKAIIRTVRKGPDEAWTAAVVDAIDEDTAVVAVPNCHWTDGAFVDLRIVGGRAREVGAALVVDASQSLGAYPLDVEEIRPDFLVSVGYKWLLGPYGLGYLYVAPEWREKARPLEASWLTRAGAEDFAGLVNYVDDYRSGSRRFDMGEYPQFVLMPMALDALNQLLDWTIRRVQVSLTHFTALIAHDAESLGATVLAPEKRVGHMVGVRLPNGITDEVRRKLAEQRVYVSVRGDALRVSPHVYNNEDDVDRLLGVLRHFATQTNRSTS